MTDLINYLNLILVIKIILTGSILIAIAILAYFALFAASIFFQKQMIIDRIELSKKGTTPTQIFFVQSELSNLFMLYDEFYGIDTIKLCSQEENLTPFFYKIIRKRILPWYEQYQTYKGYLSRNMDAIEVDKDFV